MLAIVYWKFPEPGTSVKQHPEMGIDVVIVRSIGMKMS